MRAVVTGAASGIGREFAISLARKRASIVVADIDLDGAKETERLIVQHGGEAITVQCDVSSAEQVDALAARADAWSGGVDLLINNAGVLVAGELDRLSLADYKRVIDINLWGVVHGCRSFVPAMCTRGRGKVINVASLAGAIPIPFMGAYNATKAAVIALSETMHAELRGQGVDVTVLCPSFTRSKFLGASTGPMGHSTRSVAKKLMHFLGSEPVDVARLGLEASRRGQLYAVPTVHGRLAWWAKRISPLATNRALEFGFRHLQRG